MFITGTTDGRGDFTLVVPNLLKKGVYTVTGTIVRSDGSHSGASNRLTITIGNIFSDIDLMIQLALVFMLVIVLSLLFRIIFYFKLASQLADIKKDLTKKG